MRGERQIEAAMHEAQKAANRNGHKGDWRRWSIKRLFEKLDEECLEYEQAVLAGSQQRIREEGADVIWCVVMIMDHDGFLIPFEEESLPNYHLGGGE